MSEGAALSTVDAAVEEIRGAARAGDVEAQALYAQMRAEGRGVARDPTDALHWYALAANSGHALAMNMLGRCYELGVGVQADDALAAAWYRKAAQHGLDWGMYNYAHLVAAGRGVTQDRAQAFAWYLRAAELGHAKSMNFVGRFLEEGWDVQADAEAAFEWYRRSAEGGDFRGQASYASALIDRGRVDEAVSWLHRAAKAGTLHFLERLADQLSASPHAAVRSVANELKSRARLPGESRDAFSDAARKAFSSQRSEDRKGKP